MRRVLLVQLPIPPVGPGPIKGNVPLAAGYLKLYAHNRGLHSDFDIEILPTREANELGDQGLVKAILSRDPWLVGFTCYLWNIERTLWIARRLKDRCPELKIVIGGPEVTLDNAWVLSDPTIDHAIVGEGEQTFADLLSALRNGSQASGIPGLITLRQEFPITASPAHHFLPRRPLANLDAISSPYLAGILDAADEELLMLETQRGCIFKCKFCYYPKSYDNLYFVSEEKVVANLQHARQRGAREIVLLDPTLNQRPRFAEFLKLLARENPDRQFTYFGELRAEGITPEIAGLLAEAGFDEVEIGLQSIDPLAMDLMDRHNNLRAFERGARAMLDLGIKVKVDLIIGLPGDTVDSVQRGINYIHSSGLYSQVQVFNLAILPGTAFRQEAEQLGLAYQDRPPYYVLQTPTLSTEQMVDLMTEAEDAFETEFDPLPEPRLEDSGNPKGAPVHGSVIDLDSQMAEPLPPICDRAQTFTLRLRSSDFQLQQVRASRCVEKALADNPFTTLQIVLEPKGHPKHLTLATCESLLRAAFRQPTYLDRFYSVQPGRIKGAKRLVIDLPCEAAEEWRDAIGQYATIIEKESVGKPAPYALAPTP